MDFEWREMELKLRLGFWVGREWRFGSWDVNKRGIGLRKMKEESERFEMFDTIEISWYPGIYK